MIDLLKTIASRPASFTPEDRTSLSNLLTNQAGQTSTLDRVDDNLKTVMIHVLPDKHPEGERIAKEVADDMLGEHASPYNKPFENEDIAEYENEEEEEEEEEDDDDDVLHHLRRNDDDDDEEDAAKHFSQSAPTVSLPEFLGEGSNPSEDAPATSEGEQHKEVSSSPPPIAHQHTISEPSTSHTPSSPTKPSNKSPAISDSSCPPKEAPAAREPFSETAEFVYISDSESEEEGLIPRRVQTIREPEEERRRHFIRHFEATRVKIPLRTPESEPESNSDSETEYPVPLSVIDEFDFLTKEQRAAALEEQRRMDAANESLRLAKRLYKQEHARKWVREANEEESERLAKALAEEELEQDNLKVNPIRAQEKILKALAEENPIPPQRPQRTQDDDDLEWCNKRLNHRISDAKITNISIQGKTSNIDGLKVYVTISRGGMTERQDKAQFLKFYGFTEWLEIREALQRSKSKFKGIVENIINQLLQRMSKHVNVPPLPEKSRKRRSKDADEIEEGPSFKNEHETQFNYDTILGHLDIPNISMLNTSLPEARQFFEHEIISQPEAGVIFLDNDGYLKFFRNREVPKAPTEMIRVMCYHLWSQDATTSLQRNIYERELQRRGVEF